MGSPLGLLFCKLRSLRSQPSLVRKCFSSLITLISIQLKYFPVSLELNAPEIDTIVQMWSHQGRGGREKNIPQLADHNSLCTLGYNWLSWPWEHIAVSWWTCPPQVLVCRAAFQQVTSHLYQYRGVWFYKISFATELTKSIFKCNTLLVHKWVGLCETTFLSVIPCAVLAPIRTNFQSSLKSVFFQHCQATQALSIKLT